MQNKKKNTKEGKMAVLTVKCDRSFAVSTQKTQIFKDYKANERLVEKNRILTEKIVNKVRSTNKPL